MTEYLQLADGRIAYDVSGDGPLVVCAPGMGDIRQSYRFLGPILVEAGYRVATMDIRGHGESSGDWPSYGQVARGQDIVALIRHLGGPTIVIGQSCTPDSALVAATELPQQVAATVLIAPWPRRPRLNPLLRAVQAAVVRVPKFWCMFYASLYPGSKPEDFDRYLAAVKASLSGRGGTKGLVAVANRSYGVPISDTRSGPTVLPDLGRAKLPLPFRVLRHGCGCPHALGSWAGPRTRDLPCRR
jgi:pimeloyl-ACP methyl ester carboxylesterase